MLARSIKLLPTYVYPVDEWRLVETRFYPRFLAQMETLFSTANGYLGIRGGPEEGDPIRHRGTFINGFHETWPIVYGEDAYGFARTGQTMVNAPEGHIVRLYVDDEPFHVGKVNLLHYERALDMRSGLLTREVVWEKHSGKRIRIRSRRLVSLAHRHLAAIEYEVELLNADAPVVLISELRYEHAMQASGTDPRGTRAFQDPVLIPEHQHPNGDRSILGFATRQSGMTLACGIDHTIETECSFSVKHHRNENKVESHYAVEGQAGKPVRLTKILTYHSSRSAHAEELCARADRALDRGMAAGFDSLAREQEAFVADFWERSDVQIGGDPQVQQVLRFNLFHIMQASARAEHVGIPAKGLTGPGYEGHYFWDTEIYLLPFLTYTEPRAARNLLGFRYGMLEHARKRAREVNQRGALFPWRTINGEEASAYYAAGTAQYHINADIIYALRRYVDVTGDTAFLYRQGAEMLVETARLWQDLGFYSDVKDGKFCINDVTGPDEYNTVVDNNAYTNLMARENLWFAAATLEDIRANHPDRFNELANETGLESSEIAEWKRAADYMYVPYHEERGIHLQDDEFIGKEPWDFDGTPPEKHPLLLHFHPLVVYRHQVIKQADIVLAMHLLGHHFSLEQKRRNFDFYDPLTTGDSSLSVAIQSILAFELGYLDQAREYLRYALFMDLADVASNVDQGCHLACMGSTWMACVYGAAGMTDQDGQIGFNPRLGKRFHSLRFPLTIRGCRLVVAIDSEHDTVTYLLQEGETFDLTHQGEPIHLTTGQSVTVPFKR